MFSTAFIPTGYRRLDVVIENDGIAVVGGKLAAGELLAAWIDSAGNLIPVLPQFWMTDEGPNWLAIPNEKRLVRLADVVPSTPASANDDPVSVGAPKPELTEWAVSELVVAEAERRLRQAGQSITEGAVCRVLGTMWTETGRTAGEGSIQRVRRRVRGKRQNPDSPPPCPPQESPAPEDG